MKNIIITVGLIFIGFQLSSQSRMAVQYQGKVYTEMGDTIAGPVDLQITIIAAEDSLGNGLPVYREEHSDVPLYKGLFSIKVGRGTVLGDFELNSLNEIPWGEGDYWMQVAVRTQENTSFDTIHRSELLKVPYAAYAENAGTSYWQKQSENVFYGNGKVGIGTENPEYPLDVIGSIRIRGNGNQLQFNSTAGEYDNLIHSFDENENKMWSVVLGDRSNADNFAIDHPNNSLYHEFVIDTSGNVGINTLAPKARFQINSIRPVLIKNNGGNGVYGSEIGFNAILSTGETPNKLIKLGETLQQGGAVQVVDQWGNMHFQMYDAGTQNESVIDYSPDITFTNTGNLHVNGITKTEVLNITGGSDGAEYFNIKRSEKLDPGSLVIIDEENEGKLAISSKPYDRRIAGIISEAGGVKPGITLEQKEVLEGDKLVSLWGRVYVKATTKNGSIKPGDFLTSSDLEGHVMKATRKKKSQGAIIGKALSSLESGEGLVLLLIQPQ